LQGSNSFNFNLKTFENEIRSNPSRCEIENSAIPFLIDTVSVKLEVKQLKGITQRFSTSNEAIVVQL
jgi:hypothetical protein